jgi:3D-(3,5/4)-trihydroxycyclohexane-1,2-dione acylhydrolase (decyclizing)
MSVTVRLTAAQALIRYLAALHTGDRVPLFGGVAIFGHGNVAGIGEAPPVPGRTPTYRAITSRPWRTPRSRTPKRISAAA